MSCDQYMAYKSSSKDLSVSSLLQLSKYTKLNSPIDQSTELLNRSAPSYIEGKVHIISEDMGCIIKDEEK